jgi:predicted small secreted protein
MSRTTEASMRSAQQQQQAMLAALFGLTLALGACNTTEGVGKDVERAGESIQDTAEDVEDEL